MAAICGGQLSAQCLTLEEMKARMAKENGEKKEAVKA